MLEKRVHVNKRIVSVPGGDDMLSYVKRFREKAALLQAPVTCSHMWTAPSLQDAGQCFDPIACVHMSGLLMRSPMSAGQDGFRDESSKQ